jgi:SAM-dependent methyltransferase
MEANREGENDDRHHYDEDDDKTRPFEWLTSPASLEPFLLLAMDGATRSGGNIGRNGKDDTDAGGLGGADAATSRAAALVERRTKKVLHVGSGRSALGEYLALEAKFGVALVVNADSDHDALEATRRRWDKILASRRRVPRHSEAKAYERHEMDQLIGIGRDVAEMLFKAVDLGSQQMEYPDGYFDVVVDKSTLDCAICNHGNSSNDDGGSGDTAPDPSVADFLLEVHRLVRPDGGAYLLVTFHSANFIRPLLLAPGLEWDVESFVMERRTEALQPPGASALLVPSTTGSNQAPLWDNVTKLDADTKAQPSRTPWSSKGTFEPDEAYQRTVNVLLCRRRPTSTVATVPADRSEVAAHVDAVMDEWFRQTNPMLTRAREEAIRQQMPGCVSLERGYEFLFTDSERAHYTYDLFLEDWSAYCDRQDGMSAPRQKMTHEVAIQFLREMQ